MFLHAYVLCGYTTIILTRVKLKESEKKNKYLNLGRELKKLWNMKVTIIPIVIGALGTFTKRMIQGFEVLEITGRVEIVQTTDRPEYWGDLLSLKTQKKTICKRWYEKLLKSRIIVIMIGTLSTVTEELGNTRTSGNDPNYGIVEIVEARILRILETWKYLLSLRHQWETIS